MTGKFSEKDPRRCRHYASFMSHLTLPQANAVFCGLFMTVLLLLCVSALQHHKSINLDTHKASTPRRKRHILLVRRGCLAIVFICFFLSITCTVFEVFALLNIQFCDGEDLIMLYWGFWSVLQIGSNIAIFGIILQLWFVMTNLEHPSWGVALGTPVLVFAALGYFIMLKWRKGWRRFTGAFMDVDDTDDIDLDIEEGRSKRGQSIKLDIASSRRGLENDKQDMGRWASRAQTIVPEQSIDISDMRRMSSQF